MNGQRAKIMTVTCYIALILVKAILFFIRDFFLTTWLVDILAGNPPRVIRLSSDNGWLLDRVFNECIQYNIKPNISSRVSNIGLIPGHHLSPWRRACVPRSLINPRSSIHHGRNMQTINHQHPFLLNKLGMRRQVLFHKPGAPSRATARHMGALPGLVVCRAHHQGCCRCH